MKNGYVQVYSGDGKGKTTAAVGLAVRAVGAGLRVFIAQFIKAQCSGEMRVLRERCPEVVVEPFGSGRFVHGKPTPEDIAIAEKGLARLREVVSSGEFDVVIADEANGALRAGLFDVAALLELADLGRGSVELVFTGRNAHPALLERADLVTEMRLVKHYFDSGVSAREGIEL